MTPLLQKDLFLAQQDGPSLPNVAIRLEVKGLGHIPSSKNSKMILGLRPVPGKPKLWMGTPFIGTKTEYKKVMEEMVQSFLSQLISVSQTSLAGIQTTPLTPSSIASLLPENDSWLWIRNHRVSCQKVARGEEGATITIVRIK